MPVVVYVCIYVREIVPKDGSFMRHLHYSRHIQVRVTSSPGEVFTQMAK